MDTSGYPNAYASSTSFDAALAVAEKEAAAARASAERSATLLSKMSRSGSLGSGRRSQGYALLDAVGETLLARAVSPDRGGSPVRWPPGQGNGGAARVAAQRSLNLELPVKEDGLGAEAKAPVLGRSKSGTELDDMEELAIRVSLRLEAEESGSGRPSLKRQSSANEREAPLKELWDAVFNSDEPSVSPAKLFSFASAR